MKQMACNAIYQQMKNIYPENSSGISLNSPHSLHPSSAAVQWYVQAEGMCNRGGNPATAPTEKQEQLTPTALAIVQFSLTMLLSTKHDLILQMPLQKQW